MTFDYERGALDVHLPDGTPLHIDGHFVIPAFILSLTFLRDLTVAGAIIAAGFVVVLFVSIVVHEWAHKVVAERQGIACFGIEVNGLGGLAYLDADAMRGPPAMKVLVAGPLANLTLAALLFALATMLEPWRSAIPFELNGAYIVYRPGDGPVDLVARILQAGCILNLALAAVNLLPAHPLDGGGITVEWLMRRYSRRKANRIVAGIGMALGVVSSLVFIVSIFAGTVIYAPPSVSQNLDEWEENAPPI